MIDSLKASLIVDLIKSVFKVEVIELYHSKNKYYICKESKTVNGFSEFNMYEYSDYNDIRHLCLLGTKFTPNHDWTKIYHKIRLPKAVTELKNGKPSTLKSQGKIKTKREKVMPKTKLICATSDVQRVKNSLEIIEADVKTERAISDKESALTIAYKSGADMFRAGQHFTRVTGDAPKEVAKKVVAPK